MTICATVSRNSGGSFEIDRQREELARIEERAASQDFWSDQEEAQKLLQQRSRLERIISRQEGFERAIEDVHVLL